jgi:hypothetical protein
MANGTWSLCLRPPNQNVVCNKWVFKLKQKPDGSIHHYKVRLVENGLYQMISVDYHQIFSPVIKPTTIGLVLALAVNFNWNVCQLKVSNTVLHGLLDEKVYMGKIDM